MANITKRKNKNGDISYLIRVFLSENKSGKQTVKSATFRPDTNWSESKTKKELSKFAIEFENSVKKGIATIADGRETFEDYSKTWIKAKKSTLAPSTYKRNQAYLERINQAIGHLKLNQIKPQHLSDFYNNLRESGINKNTGSGLSDKTICDHHQVINAILKSAVMQDLIPFNPVDKMINKPQRKAKEAKYLQDEDISKLMQVINSLDIKRKAIFSILINTGMRRGELCGLQWEDIDFENNTITINKSTQYLSEMGIFEKDPKTSTSNRTIKILPELSNILRQYKIWQSEEILKKGDIWLHTIDVKKADGTIERRKNTRLFTTWNGNLIHPDTITDYCSKLCKEHNLPKFSPHILRHTNVSLLINAGIPITNISKRAGHSNINTTLKVYSHAFESAEAKATEALGKELYNNYANAI